MTISFRLLIKKETVERGQMLIIIAIACVAALSFTVGFAIGGYNAANRVIDAWRESNERIYIAWEKSNKKTIKAWEDDNNRTLKVLKGHIDNEKSS